MCRPRAAALAALAILVTSAPVSATAVSSTLTDTYADDYYAEYSFAGAFDYLNEQDVVQSKHGVAVPVGGRHALDPVTELSLWVPPDDRCRVRVISPPAGRAPGRLEPDEFDCEFDAGEVVYTHYGAPLPERDRLTLLVRYDSAEDTAIVPLTLELSFTHAERTIVRELLPLLVDAPGGLSPPLGPQHIRLEVEDGERCELTLVEGLGLPRHGAVVTQLGDVRRVTCDDLPAAGIQYRHGGPTAGDRDFLPLTAEARAADGRLLRREYLQVPIHIDGGLENTPPRLTGAAQPTLDVRQSAPTPLSAAALRAEDDQTPPDQLVFNVTRPLGYGDGRLFSTDDPDAPLLSFLQRDLTELKVSYQPPSGRSPRRRTFQLGLQVVDGDGLASEEVTLSIVVHPINTRSPVVTRNTGLSMFEGQSRRLLSATNLEITDEDNLADVTVEVVGGLRHGQLLLLGAEVVRFSPADLDTGLIVYQHDGSDTTSDNVLLRASDGESEVLFVLAVTIFPEDDQPPLVTANTGLTVHRGQQLLLTPRLLAAADVDSPERQLVFELTETTPEGGEGVFLLRSATKDSAAGSSDWRLVDGMYERTVTSWSQADLQDGRVFYRHTGPPRQDAHTARVGFTVRDDADPPNRSAPQTLTVTVLPVDDTPPALTPGASLSMVVDEGRLKPIDRAALSYWDADSPPDRVLVAVTGPAREVDGVRPPPAPGGPPAPPAGYLVLTERPEQRVTNFTQAQVNHHKVAFRPTEAELGLVPRVLQLPFIVMDSAGNTLRDQLLTVFVTPVDDLPPRVTSHGLSVPENGAAVISPALLDAHDEDTPEEELRFTLTAGPRHGALSVHGRNMTIGEQFGRLSLATGEVVYLHDGSEGSEDRLEFEVSDGLRSVPAVFPITVTAVDDQPPRVLTGEVRITVQEGGGVPLTAELLPAADADSDRSLLTFLITDRPEEGVVTLDDEETDRFTTTDLDRGAVAYQHSGAEIGPLPVLDSFSLTLTDLSSEAADHITVSVTVEPVDSQRPQLVAADGALYVDEGSSAPLPPELLSLTDADTPTDQLSCVLTERPRVGYLESSLPRAGSEVRRAGPVTAFTADELETGALRYQQSVHQGVEPRADNLTVICSDGVGSSPPATVRVIIRPSNDEPPRPLLRELVVLEGGDLVIDSTLLSAADADLPADQLTFQVTAPPQHGRLLLHGEPARSFTADELRGQMALVYSHDNSETTSDGFDFRLEDGHAAHAVEGRVTVRVVPVDDEVPTLAVNRGLRVSVGGSVTLSSRELRAADLDTPVERLLFVIRTPPRHGTLSLAGVALGVGDNFTQPQLDSAALRYTHAGGDTSAEDVIRFDVSDGTNLLLDRQLTVTVTGGDRAYPRALSRGLQLPEGGTAVLTTDVLSSSDDDSDDARLEYRLTRPPQRGHLELAGSPGQPLTGFTQLQLAAGRVRYVHHAQHEERADSFEFAVSDGVHAVARAFRISLLPVDNKRPVLFKEEVRVPEGSERTITPFELKLDDRDTPSEHLLYRVVEPPLHGRLLFNHSRPVREFSQYDLDSNMISYRHSGGGSDGHRALSDRFRFVVSDGADGMYYVYPETARGTRLPTQLDIRVLAVDSRPPAVQASRAVTALHALPGGRRGVRLGSTHLQFSDPDSEGEQLMMEVTAGPESGALVDLSTNQTVTNFTQGKLHRQEVAYVLTEGPNVTGIYRDSFVYSVRDTAGNVVRDLTFSLTWSWVTLAAARYQTNETEPQLVVRLNRTGYLGGTSFVSVALENGTATVGADCSATYAAQVQFSPGQNSAEWRLPLRDDTQFEGTETLLLRLSQPVEALLGAIGEAQLEINDYEDESVVYFPVSEVRVEESAGTVEVAVERAGDLSQELTVLCVTRNDTAGGTVGGSVLSGADFLSRPPAADASRVTLAPGASRALCPVTLIDDARFEPEESFWLELREPRGGRLSDHRHRAARIIVFSDDDDAPYFHFGQPTLTVDEAVGVVSVLVFRAGTDLSGPSAVTVTSRGGEAPSATAGEDYRAISETLQFDPGQTQATVQLLVLDDPGRPRREGPEHLQLLLRLPTNATVGRPGTLNVTIDDSESDLPTHAFAEDSYSGFEEDDQVTAYVVRGGDVTMTSSVRCYTRQGSAEAGADFEERPDTDASRLEFAPGS
ncbi:FRAS1-related extracellular matrix protein 2-like [Amphibalanus amphitrite]|uniref:FRAS1-related extracellular matrix protein 2-like n=1 Tax=Amphibalanus amphitrite TaxID=1232801 RepID=UPI001C8FD212|nr:FRAS1-related extracellular matrix protein 2-like [Amphibalanus amphitrite]